jgi:hypothetical protein
MSVLLSDERSRRRPIRVPVVRPRFDYQRKPTPPDQLPFFVAWCVFLLLASALYFFLDYCGFWRINP